MLKPSNKGLNNQQLREKIEEKMLGNDWDSTRLNDSQRRLQNLEIEENKGLSNDDCEGTPEFSN